MSKYKVFIQHENEWKPFSVHEAKTGWMAIDLARKETERLLEYFNEDKLEYVNMDFLEMDFDISK